MKVWLPEWWSWQGRVWYPRTISSELFRNRGTWGFDILRRCQHFATPYALCQQLSAFPAPFGCCYNLSLTPGSLPAVPDFSPGSCTLGCGDEESKDLVAWGLGLHWQWWWWCWKCYEGRKAGQDTALLQLNITNAVQNLPFSKKGSQIYLTSERKEKKKEKKKKKKN